MTVDRSHSEIRALSAEEVDAVSGGVIVGYGHGIIVSNAGSMAW
jgi:hypothetical protein